MKRSRYKSLSGTENVSQLKPRYYFFWPGIARWIGELVISGTLSLIRLTTPLKIRILTTAEWTTFKAIGDTHWSSAEITGSFGEDVTAEVIDNVFHLSQPIHHSEAGKIVELQATVTYSNPEYFRSIARRVLSVFNSLFSEPMIQFEIEKKMELDESAEKVNGSKPDDDTLAMNE